MGGLSPEHVPERNSAVSRDSHSLVSLSLFFIPLILLSLLFTLIFFPLSLSLLFFPSFCFSLSPILTLFCSRPAGARGYRIYLVRCATLPSDSSLWLALALFDSGLNAALQGGQMYSSQEATSMDFQRPLC